ncbi:MAG: roadblock/LC7 domain-containing protein [Candidatus Hermodarchaeota archaeon]
MEEAINEIESIMRKKSVNKLTIERKYLFEIFDHDLLEIYEGLPIIKPFVELYFMSKGISVKFSDNVIKFEKNPSKKLTIENLNYFLKRLLKSIPEMKGVTIVSAEGLPIASALPHGVVETLIAAMNAALLSLAKSSVKEMKKGDFEQLFIKGSNGYIWLLQIHPNIILTVYI